MLRKAWIVLNLHPDTPLATKLAELPIQSGAKVKTLW